MANWVGGFNITPQQNMQNIKQMMQGGGPYAEWRKKKTAATAPASGNKTQVAGLSTVTDEQKMQANAVNEPPKNADPAQPVQPQPAVQPAVPVAGAPAEVVRPGWAGTGTGKIDLVGLMPGTGLYAEAVKYNKYLDDLAAFQAAPPAPANGVQPDGGPTGTGGAPATGGLTFTVGGGAGPNGSRIMGREITITPEALAAIPAEPRAELEAIVQSGGDLQKLGQWKMKYWGQPWARDAWGRGLGGGVGLSGMVKGRMQGGGGYQGRTPGNMGIKWMDDRYNANMAKWAAEEEAANQPPQATGGDYGAPTNWGPQTTPQPQAPVAQQVPQGINPILWAYLQQMLGGGQQG